MNYITIAVQFVKKVSNLYCYQVDTSIFISIEIGQACLKSTKSVVCAFFVNHKNSLLKVVNCIDSKINYDYTFLLFLCISIGIYLNLKKVFKSSSLH